MLAPSELLLHTRKHHPKISIGLSKSSKFILMLLAIALLAIPPIILHCRAPR